MGVGEGDVVVGAAVVADGPVDRTETVTGDAGRLV